MKTYHITYQSINGTTVALETTQWFKFMQMIEDIDNDRYVVNASVVIWTTQN